MRAVRIHAFGGPEVLELTEIEKPLPKDKEAAEVRAQLEHHTQGRVVLRRG